jgi:hypothetical protein
MLRRDVITLMMEAVSTSEKSANFYQTTSQTDDGGSEHH